MRYVARETNLNFVHFVNGWFLFCLITYFWCSGLFVVDILFYVSLFVVIVVCWGGGREELCLALSRCQNNLLISPAFFCVSPRFRCSIKGLVETNQNKSSAVPHKLNSKSCKLVLNLAWSKQRTTCVFTSAGFTSQSRPKKTLLRFYRF